MCKCTPNIRTPFCGRGDCLPPTECICGVGNFGVAYHRRPCPWVDVVGSEMPKHEQDRLAEADAQRALDRVWAQAIRQSQIATSEQPTKLTAQEAQQLFVELADLRTQLEQAQASADEWKRREGNVVDFGVELQERVAVLEARETALKEALAEIEKYADSFLNTHLDHYSLREISKQARGALSGEQGKETK